jgi:hypothetical protein
MGIGRMIERAGEAAGLPFPVHVHIAMAFDGLRTGGQGNGYTPAPALPGACLHHEYRALHGDVAGAVQGHLALISTRPLPHLPAWLGRGATTIIEPPGATFLRRTSGSPCVEAAAGDERDSCCLLWARNNRRQMCAAHQHHVTSNHGADFGANLSICHHTRDDIDAALQCLAHTDCNRSKCV